jgi:alpha-1,2-mannosyltransferase
MEIVGQPTHVPLRPLLAARVVLQRLGEVLVLGFFPVIIPLAMVGYLLGTYHPFGMLFDFQVMWNAGHDVVQGHSPYPFVYPAPAAVLMAPFGALPWKLAVALFWIVSMLALMLALHILEVEDWRCYGAVFASHATLWALEIGTISPLLVLAAAVAWKYRDRPQVVAAAVAFVIVMKLFLWPLALWLLATRRYRAVLASILQTVALVIGCWAIIGFAGFLSYPRHLGGIASTVQFDSFSVLALGKALGLSTGGARVASMLVGLAAIGLIFLAARGRHGDHNAFVAAIAASLLLSPIVWVHYFVLLYVPIALARKNLGLLWLLPLAFWALPHAASNGSVPHILLGLGVTFAVLLGSARFERNVERVPAVASANAG